ncbi:MAG: bacillithiol biosynthesis deacetylase BshB1 [Ignavibacteriaceae bacterium]|nr:bacillithiol biosynthesis deacetylase BshB1 [Ignavibacteriaceae bacterium]
MNLDIIVFGSHPDDAELAMGGTIAKLTANNLKVGIIDLTRGELGTRGTVATRKKEAAESAAILKTAVRDNLHFPDGGIDVNKDYMKKIIMVIRKYTPKLVFAPYFNDRHPDHIYTSRLIKEAVFSSGLDKIKTTCNKVKQKSYRPVKIFYYMQTYTFDPTFIVDITGYHEIKMKAVKSYSTQFYNPKSREPQTFISKPEFLNYIEARSLYYGFQIGKLHGEPFYSEEKIELDLLSFIK